MGDDLNGGGNGWGARAFAELSRRVDALERAFNALTGRPLGSPPPTEHEAKIGGLGVATWISIVALIVVPLVVAIIAT